MIGLDTAKKVIEDTTATMLDAVSAEVDNTAFKVIGDKVLNKVEGCCKEGGWADNTLEEMCSRLRVRCGIEDSNPEN